MIVVSIFIVTVVSYCIIELIKYVKWAIRAANMTYNIPGPKPWPIIGSAHLFVNINSSEGNFKYINNLLVCNRCKN